MLPRERAVNGYSYVSRVFFSELSLLSCLISSLLRFSDLLLMLSSRRASFFTFLFLRNPDDTTRIESTMLTIPNQSNTLIMTLIIFVSIPVYFMTGIPLSPFYAAPPAGQRLLRLCFAKNDETVGAAIERLARL